MVVQVGHNGLVHGTVPLNESRLSESVSVDILVVLVEHGVLPGSPLSVAVGNRGVGGQDSSGGPVEKIGVVGKRLGVLSVVVQDNGSLVNKTTSDTSGKEVDDPGVHDSGTGIE